MRWRPLHDVADFAIIWCPRGHVSTIGAPAHRIDMHSISEDGAAVTPSLVCPRCEFHVYGWLDQWPARHVPNPDASVLQDDPAPPQDFAQGWFHSPKPVAQPVRRYPPRAGDQNWPVAGIPGPPYIRRAGIPDHVPRDDTEPLTRPTAMPEPGREPEPKPPKRKLPPKRPHELVKKPPRRSPKLPPDAKAKDNPQAVQQSLDVIERQWNRGW